MIKLVLRIFLCVYWLAGLVFFVGSVLGAVGCVGQQGQHSSAPTPDADGMIRPFGVVEPGGVERSLVPTTAPGMEVDDPRVVLDVSFFDAVTGAAVAGDVVLGRVGDELDVVCEGMVLCSVAVLATGADGAPWRVGLRADGYVAQEFEFTANTRSHRRMDMPVQLMPVGDGG